MIDLQRATVTQVAPLRVRLDGATADSPADAFATFLATVGRRVRVAAVGSTLLVLDQNSAEAVAGAPLGYGCRVYRVAGTPSIANNAVTAIPMDGETFDLGGLHDPASNTRVVLNRLGLWTVRGQVQYAGNGTGSRQARIHLNGAYNGYSAIPGHADGSGVQVSVDIIAAAVTDYVELCAYQTSGGALALSGGGGPSEVWLSATYQGAT